MMAGRVHDHIEAARRAQAQARERAAFSEVGGGITDPVGTAREGGHHLLDGAAKALGEEGAAGEMQARLRLAAALIDGERIGLGSRSRGAHAARRQGRRGAGGVSGKMA